MKATIYQDHAKEWRWRLTADNGEPLADSGEGYKRQLDCRHGLQLVLGADPDMTIETYIPA